MCSGDCNQGRNCDCVPKEYDKYVHDALFVIWIACIAAIIFVGYWRA